MHYTYLNDDSFGIYYYDSLQSNYYPYEKNQVTYFKYSPIKNNKKQFSSKILKKENAFSVLKNINFK